MDFLWEVWSEKIRYPGNMPSSAIKYIAVKLSFRVITWCKTPINNFMVNSMSDTIIKSNMHFFVNKRLHAAKLFKGVFPADKVINLVPYFTDFFFTETAHRMICHSHRTKTFEQPPIMLHNHCVACKNLRMLTRKLYYQPFHIPFCREKDFGQENFHHCLHRASDFTGRHTCGKAYCLIYPLTAV